MIQRMNGFVQKNRAALLGTSSAVAIGLATFTIQWHEGTKLKTYRDPVGILTYCTGETTNARIGQTYTKEECAEILSHRLTGFNADVESCVHRPMTVGIRVTWLDTVYNLGKGGFCKSAMVRLYNAGDVRGACDALKQYVYARGVWLKGLFERREDMIEVCYAGIPQ